MMVIVVTMVRLMAMVMVVAIVVMVVHIHRSASYRGFCHEVIETVPYDDDDDSLFLLITFI